MEKKHIKIPKSYKVGGQLMEVREVERCEDNKLGRCSLAGGWIEIASIFNKDQKCCESGRINTFYHELTHAILDTMGEDDLSNNEKFVSCFSSFLTEAMEKAYFEEE
jgi:hypothetical protein